MERCLVDIGDEGGYGWGANMGVGDGLSEGHVVVVPLDEEERVLSPLQCLVLHQACDMVPAGPRLVYPEDRDAAEFHLAAAYPAAVECMDPRIVVSEAPDHADRAGDPDRLVQPFVAVGLVVVV